jgi:hypothetical protein
VQKCTKPLIDAGSSDGDKVNRSGYWLLMSYRGAALETGLGRFSQNCSTPMTLALSGRVNSPQNDPHERIATLFISNWPINCN